MPSWTTASASTARSSAGARRTWLAFGLVLVLAMALGTPNLQPAEAQSQDGGPVVLMGIDAEDGGVGGHGPVSVYVDVVGSILDEVTSGGDGILVVGEAEDDGTDVIEFWDEIGAQTGESITYVGGAEDIAAQSLDGFAMLGVVTSEHEFSGSRGLTEAENDALTARSGDIALFVNRGGGLLGFSQSGLEQEYAYVGGLGDFETAGGQSYRNIAPTGAGTDIGITDALDICCWHDHFDTFPDFLDILAYDDDTDEDDVVAAIGGASVTIPTGIELEPETAALEVGETHELIATVEEDEEPAADVEVTFTATDGPHAGELGTATTDADGEATLQYTGTAVGTDTVEAAFEDSLLRRQTSNEVTVDWSPAPDALTLSPGEAELEVGDTHEVTATLSDSEAEPVDGAEITFTVTDGPHEGETGTATTDGDGEASFSYEGSDVGTDTVVASHLTDADEEVTSNEVTAEWSEVLAEQVEQEPEEPVETEPAEAEPAEPVEAEPTFTG